MSIELISALAWFFAINLLTLQFIGLADPTDRKQLMFWMAIGAFGFALKHLLLTALPQWGDTPADSQTYVLHAKALYLHWNDAAVDPEAYRLSGYLNWWRLSEGSMWSPEARISYAGVLGTYEWLYAGMLGLHQHFGVHWAAWGTATNVALSALMPSATWLIAKELNAGKFGATCAAVAMLLDPSISINASWLLKDALATSLSVLALLAGVHLIKARSPIALISMTLALTLLAGTRFVGYVAIVFSFLLVVFVIFMKRDAFRVAPLVAATASFAVFLWISTYPAPLQLQSAIDTSTGRLEAPAEIYTASRQDSAVDPTVHSWQLEFRENPFSATLKAISQTLFAPYPWSPLNEPLDWTTYIELYLLGSVFWLLCLPLIGWGVIVALRRRNYVDILLLSTVSVLAMAYIIFFGEWSTRQRVFMNPVFFAFLGLGASQAQTKIKMWRRGGALS